jgi:hypothetical protein
MIEAAAAVVVVVVREYDVDRDHAVVEEVERACEVGCSGAGKMSLFTDLLGDPLCRIRNSPAFLMLVRAYCTIPTCLLCLPLAVQYLRGGRGGRARCAVQAAACWARSTT